MDSFENPVEVLSMATTILVLLLNANRALSVFCEGSSEEETLAEDAPMRMHLEDGSTDIDVMMKATLMHYRLWNTLPFLDEDLGYWVKPRSTTWFSRFLLHEYDDSRWIQMFRFSKRSVFTLAQALSPAIQKKDTKYRLAIPVSVRLACTLFKLSHGASLLICSEMFAVGRSTVSIMLREVIHALNVLLRAEISWPTRDEAVTVAANFERVCGLPGVMGAIDGTHFAISKPRFAAADYFYFKSGGYTINCQAVVDSSRRFLDLYVGMPGSTNDSRMLRRSTLFYRGQRQSLWNQDLSFNGFSPYLIGDGGYPLLPWLMVPHRHESNLPFAQQLFNRRLSRGRASIENAFGLLKLTFRELHHKSDLQVLFLPDVVTCCALLHNLLLKQSQTDTERLLDVIREEEAQRPQPEVVDTGLEDYEVASQENANNDSHRKRTDLAVFLSLQRPRP